MRINIFIFLLFFFSPINKYIFSVLSPPPLFCYSGKPLSGGLFGWEEREGGIGLNESEDTREPSSSRLWSMRKRKKGSRQIIRRTTLPCRLTIYTHRRWLYEEIWISFLFLCLRYTFCLKNIWICLCCYCCNENVPSTLSGHRLFRCRCRRKN